MQKLMRLAFGISGGIIVILIAVFTSYFFFDDIEDLEEGSPEKIVQTYLNNVIAREFTKAYNTLDLTTREKCTIEEFVVASVDISESLKGTTINLNSVDVFDDNAIVILEISSIENSGFFSTYENKISETLFLKFSNNTWAITGTSFNLIC